MKVGCKSSEMQHVRHASSSDPLKSSMATRKCTLCLKLWSQLDWLNQHRKECPVTVCHVAPDQCCQLYTATSVLHCVSQLELVCMSTWPASNTAIAVFVEWLCVLLVEAILQAADSQPDHHYLIVVVKRISYKAFKVMTQHDIHLT